MPLDLNSTQQSISSKLDAFKTYADVSKSEKGFLGKLANSSSEANSQITSQLDKVKDLQKRFQRDPKNSMDQLLGFLGQTQGNGSGTLIYLRKKNLRSGGKNRTEVIWYHER